MGNISINKQNLFILAALLFLVACKDVAPRGVNNPRGDSRNATYKVAFTVNDLPFSEFGFQTRDLTYPCLTDENIDQTLELLYLAGIPAIELQKTPSTEGCAP